jgi:hypothetical protein
MKINLLGPLPMAWKGDQATRAYWSKAIAQQFLAQLWRNMVVSTVAAVLAVHTKRRLQRGVGTVQPRLPANPEASTAAKIAPSFRQVNTTFGNFFG